MAACWTSCPCPAKFNQMRDRFLVTNFTTGSGGLEPCIRIALDNSLIKIGSHVDRIFPHGIQRTVAYFVVAAVISFSDGLFNLRQCERAAASRARRQTSRGLFGSPSMSSKACETRAELDGPASAVQPAGIFAESFGRRSLYGFGLVFVEHPDKGGD